MRVVQTVTHQPWAFATARPASQVAPSSRPELARCPSALPVVGHLLDDDEELIAAATSWSSEHAPSDVQKHRNGPASPIVAGNDDRTSRLDAAGGTLARHYRDEEGLSIAEIARRLGRADATIRPTSTTPPGRRREPSRPATSACAAAAAATPAAKREGRRLRLLQGLHPGAIQARWTRARVLAAMGNGARGMARFPPPMTGHTPTHAGEGRRARRLAEGQWPAASVVTVSGSREEFVQKPGLSAGWDAFGGSPCRTR